MPVCKKNLAICWFDMFVTTSAAHVALLAGLMKRHSLAGGVFGLNVHRGVPRLGSGRAFLQNNPAVQSNR